jgi:hypothetical protein
MMRYHRHEISICQHNAMIPLDNRTSDFYSLSGDDDNFVAMAGGPGF